MTKIIILGCGSSLGSPWITNYWGKCNKSNPKNIRSRCSIFIQNKNLSVMIDTSPDIKKQILNNNIKDIDYVLYTHEHADQTAGIWELRPFFWKRKKTIDIFADKRTLKILMDRHDYCFFGGQGYIPILKGNLIKKSFTLSKKKNKLNFITFPVSHGWIKSTAYIFNKTAYISDCNGIKNKDLKKLMDLNLLIVDCLKINQHPSHFNLNQAINLSKKIKAKKTILTNLHTDLDYEFLKKSLPKNIIPAYDGMKLNI
tara:strand:- start:1722 stop:2489 length:768 start_codon:yes stop_codon:yes gene_type:complete